MRVVKAPSLCKNQVIGYGKKRGLRCEVLGMGGVVRKKWIRLKAEKNQPQTTQLNYFIPRLS